jgi:potassium channel subfamily K
MKRWTVAVKWRLDKARLPVWVPVDKDKDFEWPREMEIRNGRWQPWSHLAKWNRHSRHSNNEEIELTPRPRARSMRLNLRALSKAQLQAAAMEAGAPLQELLPRHPDHYVDIPYYCSHGSEVISPTQHRLGHMMLLVRNFAYAVSVGQTPAPSRFTTFTDGSGGEEIPSDQNLRTRMNSPDERLTFVELEREERRMFAIRITIALSLFLTFWLVSRRVCVKTSAHSALRRLDQLSSP